MYRYTIPHRHVLSLVTALTLTLFTLSAHATDASNAFTSALTKGPGAASLAAFVGGLLVSLTPCVYPMVAVTVSVFGAASAKNRLHGILLSSAFVFGIMVTFVALGLVAALSGSVFGSALQSTWVVLTISLLFVAMAVSMFGAFELALPTGLLNWLATVGGIGVRGAFLLGLVCGLVASPCTGPVLTGILAWIAVSQDLLLGTLAMCAFAAGLGVPFFVVGAFAVQLPKSGRWMVTAKSALGTMLLVVALYFASSKLVILTRLVPMGSQGWAVVAVASTTAVALLLSMRRSLSPPLSRAVQVVAVLLFAYSGFGVVIKLGRAERSLTWQHQPYAQARQRAHQEKLPLLVDFTASWCTACKALDRETFSNPEVRLEAGRFLALKIDASSDDDPAVQQTMKELSVRGLPTVILFDTQGREQQRFNDFVSGDAFLGALRKVR